MIRHLIMIIPAEIRRTHTAPEPISAKIWPPEVEILDLTFENDPFDDDDDVDDLTLCRTMHTRLTNKSEI